MEIIFETKDLSDEKIKEILEKFTDAEFTIMRVEDSKTGELRVIIKFELRIISILLSLFVFCSSLFLSLASKRLIMKDIHMYYKNFYI